MLPRASSADDGPRGAERALQHRIGISRSRLRRRALRRRGPRPPRVLRPPAATASTPTAARAPTATWRRTISSSRPPTPRRRFQLLQRRRRGNPDADDPLFRPIDADDFRTNGESASDFSNLRQNGLVRITFPLPSNIKLIDPATNAPSAETFVDVWRSVPTVNDVALTGPDGVNPWPRGPNPTGGYQLDARVTTLQEQALGALTNHAQIQNAPPQQLLDDLASFQRVLFTNRRVRALADAIREGTTPLPDPDPPLNELEQQGKVVFVRACAQCHGGPGQSTPQAPVVRFHDIVEPVSASRRHRDARPLRLRAVPAATRSQCPDVRDHAGERHQDPSHELRSRSRAADRVRRRPCPPRTIGTSSTCPHFAGIRKTAPYFHNNSAATLEEVVDHYMEFFKRVQGECAAGCRATGTEHGRRALRSAAHARRARAAAGVPAQAIGRPRLPVRDWTIFPRFAYGGLKPFR